MSVPDFGMPLNAGGRKLLKRARVALREWRVLVCLAAANLVVQ
jgi:hypothetical protein